MNDVLAIPMKNAQTPRLFANVILGGVVAMSLIVLFLPLDSAFNHSGVTHYAGLAVCIFAGAGTFTGLILLSRKTLLDPNPQRLVMMEIRSPSGGNHGSPRKPIQPSAVRILH